MIQVELHNRTNNLIKVLPRIKHGTFYAQLNTDGSGSFKIHRSDPDAIALNVLGGGIDGYVVHLLRRGPLALPGDAFVDRFAFVVEGIAYDLSEREEEEGWITVSGRGTLCLLEDRTAYPPGYDGSTQASITAQWQSYIGVAAGAIMTGEIDRSASRFVGAGPTLTHSISQATLLQTVKLRFDNLRKLHDYLVQNAPMDAQMVGVDYQSFNQLGIDRSAAVTIAMSLLDSVRQFHLERDNRAVKNWVVAQGTGEGINATLVSAQDVPSQSSFRRREGFLDARNDDSATQLGIRATSAISQLKNADVRITGKFLDSAHSQVYRDFTMGDTVTLKVQAPLPMLGGVPQAPQVIVNAPYRVVGIQVADNDEEIEEINLDLNSIRQEYLLRLNKSYVQTSDSLNVINRMPQGSAWNDTQTYPDNCGPSFPFHFNVFVPSNVLKLNYGKLSFFLQAFRGYEATSAGGTTHQHTTPNHNHLLATFQGAIVSGTNNAYQFGTSGSTQKINLLGDTGADIYTQSATGSATSGNESAHTHPMVAGIYESTVATGVTVKINGVDRTAALGGGSGFTTDQTELEISQWLNIGQKNTIDLTPTGLGRILGSLRITGYAQSI